MTIARCATLLLLLPLLLAACSDDPDQPNPSTGINFPTNSQNVWIYRTQELDQNGNPTGETLFDTARVVGTLERGGRTGTIIRIGAIRGDSNFTASDYEEAPYAIEPGKLYTIIDMIDTTTFYGTQWILLANESATTWTALDTTEVRASDTLTTHTTITGQRGSERTITVKGTALVGREYILHLTQVVSKSGVDLSTISTTAHYWLAPGVGIIAMQEESIPGRNGLDRVLIDYTIH